MNAVFCQHTYLSLDTKIEPHSAKTDSLTKTTNDEEQKYNCLTDFYLCIFSSLFPVWNFLKRKSIYNQQVMEKTQEYFGLSTKGIYYQVERQPLGCWNTRHHNAHLPSEGQRCRMQPVALIGNFCCCRFPLSKGQPGTVH